MKKFLIYCLVVCLALISHDIAAQTMARKVKVRKNQPPVQVMADSIKTDVDIQKQYDSIVVVKNALERQVDSLKNVLDSRNSIIETKDSIIVSRDAIISMHEDRKGYIDTCTVRLANRWLYENYSEDDVNYAIRYFDRILSTDLKSEIFIIRELLAEYKPAYREFVTIINDASVDPEKEMKFRQEAYAKKYIARIKNMQYYKKYFKSQMNIGYLNAKITTALEILNDHINGEKADFSILYLESNSVSSSRIN